MTLAEYESPFRGYDEWAKTIWMHIVDDPMTDEDDWIDVREATVELSIKLCLNQKKILNKVEQYQETSSAPVATVKV